MLEPDFQAVRQVALARKRGFEAITGGQSGCLERLVEGPDHDRRRRSALAGLGRRCAFLPVQLNACRVTRVDLDLRSRDMARLPLLLWPRDVGHRDLRRSGPQPPAAARRRKHSRLPNPQALPAPPAMPVCVAEGGFSSRGRARRHRDKKRLRCRAPHRGMRITCPSTSRGPSRSIRT